MSSIKEYLFDYDLEEMRRWICEELDDEYADEDTPGWESLAEEWSNMHASNEAITEFFDWYKQHAHSEIHQTFHLQISKLKDLLEMTLPTYNEDTFYKMTYAYAVTLMESFLADTIRSLIITDDRYFFNAINNVDTLKDCKFTISEIAKQTDGARGFAVTELSKLMYHNIPKIREVLKAVLGRDIKIDISQVCTITALRHDIVHRDGKKTDGQLIIVDKEIAKDTVLQIEEFVNSLAKKIYAPQ
ncbi:hypothetical protein [Shewanella sp. KJ2020]|uniref:hypothetical protein n=1 Tax=Shewanella sp. KJ2020 TaxID=2919172 RepID=UPI0020A7F412|nr:hypothetical protein [Shewanella sp. KJ2020]MCP3130060.1 hypothetical protein [Shewanella sp. KJ2020]